ncbi:MAG: hypothetical protein WKF84_21745 [Pyrinomonadaceae bacterium]
MLLPRAPPPRAEEISTGRDERAPKSIAILPFHNLSGDAAVNFYEYSLADAVITELARISSLVVRPSSAMAKYQGRKTVDPLEAGRELSVSAVLASTFLRVGERLARYHAAA